MKKSQTVVLSRRALMQLAGIVLAGAGAVPLYARDRLGRLEPRGLAVDPDAAPGSASEVAPDGSSDLDPADLNAFIESYAPEAGSIVRANSKVRIVFVESSVSGDAIDPGTVQLFVDGLPAAMAPYYAARRGNREFRHVPFPFWAPNHPYTVLLQSGVSYQKSGEMMEEPATWTFRTESTPIEEYFQPGVTQPLTDQELALAHAGKTDRFVEENLVKDYQDAESSLYRISPAVDPTDPEVIALGEKMVNSLTALGAIGMAAPQLGINRRLFVAQISGKKYVFINPKPTSWSETLYYGQREGCLSIENVWSRVGRPSVVRVEYDAPGGSRVTDQSLQNDNAKVWLHEYDHVNGILMVDRQQDKLIGQSDAGLTGTPVPITPRRL